MRKLLIVLGIAGAALVTSVAPASAACVEVDGNGTTIYSGPLGTVHGVDVDTNPRDCIATAEAIVTPVTDLILPGHGG